MALAYIPNRKGHSLYYRGNRGTAPLHKPTENIYIYQDNCKEELTSGQQGITMNHHRHRRHRHRRQIPSSEGYQCRNMPFPCKI